MFYDEMIEKEMKARESIDNLSREGLITQFEKAKLLGRIKAWIKNDYNPKKPCRLCEGIQKIIRI